MVYDYLDSFIIYKYIMKNLRQNKDFRVFLWTVFNALVAFAGTELANITGELQVYVVGIAIPSLNALTKYINIRYFNDLWVTKK